MTNSLDQAINELSFITCAVCQAQVSSADNFCQGCGASQYRTRQPGGLNQLAPFVPGNLMVLTCSSCGSNQVKEPQPCTCCGQNIIGKFELTSIRGGNQANFTDAVEPPYVKITQTVKTTDVSLGSKHLSQFNLHNVIVPEAHVPEIKELEVEPVASAAHAPAFPVPQTHAPEVHVPQVDVSQANEPAVEPVSENNSATSDEKKNSPLGAPILGRGLHSFSYGAKHIGTKGNTKLKESFSLPYLGRAIVALAIIAFYAGGMWLLARGGKYTSAALCTLTKNLQPQKSKATTGGGTAKVAASASSEPIANSSASRRTSSESPQALMSELPRRSVQQAAERQAPPPPPSFSQAFDANAPLAQTKVRKLVAKQTWDIHGKSEALNVDGNGDANASNGAEQTLVIQDEQTQFASPVKPSKDVEVPIKAVEEPVKSVQPPKPPSSRGTWKIEYANEPVGSAQQRGGRLASNNVKAEKPQTSSSDMSCYNKFLSLYFAKLKEAEPSDLNGEVEPPSFDEWLKLGKPKF